jgi:transaldolase
MKLFLDTADVEAIERANDTGLLDGVTTNPSLVAKSGKPFYKVVEEICGIVDGPVSAEAVAETAEEMVTEACKISQIAPNVVVKLPATVDGLKAAAILERAENVRVNLTMVFSAAQAYLAFKARVSYVSIVLSRLDAVGNESDILIADTMRIHSNYGYKTEVIAGSVKTQNHILSCLRAGVHIATVPESLFFQMFKHPLTDLGLRDFSTDWAKVIQR